ncbi:uncharacterized protein BDR25DRAFT_350644 [Lindgomyces ingoldianus]|uniref:Uncharacterized protein n=1 Tax=Lindgomyces ingoldianus TaxID=673940 RepID=A0ACB6R9W8_9PLEO|nr:uncharacterized protein BDR25DRAFT_350644 [Lindgomyces ingoldianus]KAF2475251.1 hypothetical protein BDR25DRAFT_350644 [Lindgomyces ingoldianus]
MLDVLLNLQSKENRTSQPANPLVSSTPPRCHQKFHHGPPNDTENPKRFQGQSDEEVGRSSERPSSFNRPVVRGVELRPCTADAISHSIEIPRFGEDCRLINRAATDINGYWMGESRHPTGWINASFALLSQTDDAALTRLPGFRNHPDEKDLLTALIILKLRREPDPNAHPFHARRLHTADHGSISSISLLQAWCWLRILQKFPPEEDASQNLFSEFAPEVVICLATFFSLADGLVRDPVLGCFETPLSAEQALLALQILIQVPSPEGIFDARSRRRLAVLALVNGAHPQVNAQITGPLLKPLQLLQIAPSDTVTPTVTIGLNILKYRWMPEWHHVNSSSFTLTGNMRTQPYLLMNAGGNFVRRAGVRLLSRIQDATFSLRFMARFVRCLVSQPCLRSLKAKSNDMPSHTACAKHGTRVKEYVEERELARRPESRVLERKIRANQPGDGSTYALHDSLHFFGRLIDETHPLALGSALFSRNPPACQPLGLKKLYVVSKVSPNFHLSVVPFQFNISSLQPTVTLQYHTLINTMKVIDTLAEAYTSRNN